MTQVSLQGPQRWFLSDKPITTTEQDAFSHSDVADNLLSMIGSAGDDERVMIGLLGPFGVGKSTVIELLAGRMTDGKGTVLRISAERHEQAGLHSSLIYAFAEQLAATQPRQKGAITDILDTLQYATSRTAADFSAAPIVQLPRSIQKMAERSPLWARVMVALLVILAVTTMAIGVTIGWGGFAAFFAALTFLATAVTAAVPNFLLKSISGFLSDVTKSGSRTLQRSRVETADEYERTFADLVKLSKSRLIIAVDDIDRLSPTEVLVALNAIRSFQLTCSARPPVFIVSADEGIIETAVSRAHSGPASRPAGRAESAQAFLDRLFTHRQEMPVHAPTDLVGYALSLLGADDHVAPRLLGEELREVVEVLIHDGVEEPRHAIRILNAFFGDYRLAYRRERQSKTTRSIMAGVVTEQPRFLARLSVLKLDFPRFHKALFHDEELLGALERDIEGLQELDSEQIATMGYELASESQQVQLEWSGLRTFIGRTASVPPVDDLRPFLYLGQGDLERVIGGAYARRARSALVNRQTADFLRIVEETAARADSNERMQALVELTRGTLRRAADSELENTVRTLTAAVHLLPATSHPDLASGVATAFRNGVPTPRDVQPIFTLAMAATETHTRALLARRVLLPEEDDTPTRATSLLVVRHRADLAQILGHATVTSQISAALERLGRGSLTAVESWFEQLGKTPLPDLADRVLEAAVRALLNNEEDLPPEWEDPLNELMASVRTTHAEARYCPYTQATLEASVQLLQADPNSRSSMYLIGHLAQYPQTGEWTTRFLEAMRAGTLDADGDLLLTNFPALPGLLALLATLADYAEDDEDVSEISAISAAYAPAAVSQGHGVVLNTVVGALLAADPVVAEATVGSLLSRWLTEAPVGDAAMEGIVDSLTRLSSGSRQELEATLELAVQPSSRTALIQAAVRHFPGLAKTTVGADLLIRLAKKQSRFISYGQSLIPLRPFWQALYAAVDVDTAITNDVINKYAQLPPYGGEWLLEMFETYTSVDWTSDGMASMMQVLSTQTQNMTPTHYWALARQLSRMFVSPPTTLLPGLASTLVDHGSLEDADRKTLLAVGPRLPADTIAQLALSMEHGRDLIHRMPPESVGSFMVFAISRINDDRALAEAENSRSVISSTWRLNPQAYAASIGDHALEEIDRERNLSISTWSLLLSPVGSEFRDMLRTVAEAANSRSDWGGMEQLFSVALVRLPQDTGDLLLDSLTTRLRSDDPNLAVVTSLSRIIATNSELAKRAYNDVSRFKRPEAAAARATARSILKP